MNTLPTKAVFEQEDFKLLTDEFNQLENKNKELEVQIKQYKKILSLLGSHSRITLTIPKTGDVNEMYISSNAMSDTVEITFR